LTLLRGLIILFVVALNMSAECEETHEYVPGASARVRHPATTLKAEDLDRAQRNIIAHAWAKEYAKNAMTTAASAAAGVTPEWLRQMGPETTPGDTLFTPCPACRDQGKPVHPHGLWQWSPDKPDQLQCKSCGTIFPNERYPESIVLTAKWGGEQKFTFYGGPTFVIFSLREGRPSFTGNMRAYKVNYVQSRLSNLTLGYALSKEESLAAAARLILLRFADTYPRWLVHSGYGDYADMDPKIAAAQINNLPEPELVYPPNQPDRKLHTGYWSAGRARGVGMEQGFVVTCVEAYDLMYDATFEGKPLFSDQDRLKIERDLLFEGASMLWPDPNLNNKSVGGRMACLLVGLCLGNPELVRFGWSGFEHTVNDWFLDDGATSESPGYASMTLSGVWPIAEAMKGYSDPPGYLPKGGPRIHNLNPYHDTCYPLVWRAMYNTLQGDLKYPPIEDSYSSSSLSALSIELMAANYDDPRYLALLKEVAGADLSGGSLSKAIFLRDPELAKRPSSSIHFEDVTFPELRWGVFRTGAHGRDGFLCLNADEFRGHHHYDSLDLYYWRDNQELLSDLGYLWDHPDKRYLYRTAAHNLVVIDGKEQAGRGQRGGQFHLFSPVLPFKVMEASSRAYPDASVYRRTVMQIDHGDKHSYVLDVFRVLGGEQRDYLFHGPNNEYRVGGMGLAPWAGDAASIGYAALKNVRTATGSAPWKISWELPDQRSFTAWSPGGVGEQVFIGEGWGQRDWKNSDRGATLPYVMRRLTGDEPSVFISVFEGSKSGEECVRSVRSLKVAGDLATLPVAVEVQQDGLVDVFFSAVGASPALVETSAGRLAVKGLAAHVTLRDGQAVTGSLIGGTSLKIGRLELTLPVAVYRGAVTGQRASEHDGYYEIAGNLPPVPEGAHQTLFVDDGKQRRAFPILSMEAKNGRATLRVKSATEGFDPLPGKSWEIIPRIDKRAIR